MSAKELEAYLNNHDLYATATAFKRFFFFAVLGKPYCMFMRRTVLSNTIISVDPNSGPPPSPDNPRVLLRLFAQNSEWAGRPFMVGMNVQT
jgi:hypothetical protein